MKKIFLFEPSIASNNVGDQVIVESIKKELSSFLNDTFYIELPTHTPISNRYMFFLGKPDMKIICGSNIIIGKLNTFIHLKQWMLSLFTLYNLKDSIFIGVGSQKYRQRFNLYTRFAYRFFFKKNFLHSVRDSYTEKTLKKLGINNVVNTGCPTMWCLTQSHCSEIPQMKANNVVFTLTDYNQNRNRDNYLIAVLKSEYNNIYFWPQGYGDYSYFSSLHDTKDITIVPPHLFDYDLLLEKGDIDFVGTRLHGGIRALQKKVRTLIIGIDNRATELKKDFNLPVIDQFDIKNLGTLLNTNVSIDIQIPLQNISLFKNQFGINKK